MNKIIDMCLCVLAVFIWITGDVLNLLSVIFDSLGDIFSVGSCCLEHFIAFLINKNRKRNLK